MRILTSISQLSEANKGSVVTIGNFDGLHLGHQEIICTAKKLADKHNTFLVVLTFDPHPISILNPEKTPEILTPRPLKEKILEELGVDYWLIVKTQKNVLSLSPPDFIEQYIVEPLSPVAMVEGEDFNFGAARAGNVQLLEHLGSANGFDVKVVSAKRIELSETVRISSTMIRFMLESGDVSDASTALGRNYKLIGQIISGRGKGTEIGFPTLNMQKPDQLIPAEGVYAGRVVIADSYEGTCRQGDTLDAIFSIGQARTFGDQHPLLIEAHLLEDTDEDFTDKYMSMEFIDHIRRQHKFTTPKELAEQIAKDCKIAKHILFESR